MSGLIVGSALTSETLRVSFVNPHSFDLLLRRDPVGRFKADLEEMDLLAPDGVGVVAASRLLGLGRPPRYGFDLLAPVLMPALASQDVPVFLFGGKAGIADAAADVLKCTYNGLRVAGTQHGYIDEAEIPTLASRIAGSGARVVCIGTGAPRQEHWAAALSEALPGHVFVTCGGYFDQVLLPKPYFPSWSHRLGLNWLVRLFREPRRLWKRCLVETTRFVFDTVGWAMRGGVRRDGLATQERLRKSRLEPDQDVVGR